MRPHADAAEHQAFFSVAADDATYDHDVLGLREGETEGQIGDGLRDEAKGLGVDVDALLLPPEVAPHVKPLAPDMPRASQESVASRASQSTGLTSNCSDVSRDYFHAAARGRPAFRTSLSLRDYDAFLARGVPNGRHSMTFSSPPTTPSHSTFSLPLSSPEPSPKRPFPRIRGLSMLRLHRTGSSRSAVGACPHCPPDPQSSWRAVHPLPCGHRLCTQALRNTITAATESTSGAVPSCCGIPIPGHLVEHVMTQAEQNALLEKLEQWDDAASIAPSVVSESRLSAAYPRPGAPPTAGGRTASNASKVDSVVPSAHPSADQVMERADFQQLRHRQTEQRERFLAWIDAQRSALDAQHEALRRELRARHDAAVEHLREAHDAAVSEAEDKQVKAEADMREAHRQEKRDQAIGLKHMEAYCAGTYSTGERHHRTVTEQDRAELEKARRTRDQMDAKHESAINILRGEQSRRIKRRHQRQEAEVQQLRAVQRNEDDALERAWHFEAQQRDANAADKRRRLQMRWQLETAIWLKRVEMEMGVAVRGQIPPLE